MRKPKIRVKHWVVGWYRATDNGGCEWLCHIMQDGKKCRIWFTPNEMLGVNTVEYWADAKGFTFSAMRVERPKEYHKMLAKAEES